MSFKDQAAEDLDRVLHSNEDEEMIRYTPNGAAERFINALVDRKRTVPAGEDGGRTLIDSGEITISRNETLGVSMITKGKDKVVLADVIGGKDVVFVVVDIIDQDDAVWTLSLRK
jgi:hypothetical protein